MPAFRTPVPLPTSFPQIDYESHILAVGSCFTENIGSKLAEAKFRLSLNPTGILYNPHSIGQLLGRLLEGREYQPEELFHQNGLWHSFDHHSAFSMPDTGQALEKMNTVFRPVANNLSRYTHLLLALGTAYVYQHSATDKLVANCHKIPGHEFDKIRLSVEAIVSALKPNLRKLKQLNPAIKVIITVSPVRHLRDGLHENNLSKASLLLAAEQLCAEVSDAYYFPSYEILTDELRDYRFYADDMAHPSKLAVEYIWQRFLEVSISSKTRQALERVRKLVQAAHHRPFHSSSSGHQDFVRKQLELIADMEKQYPGMDWSKEKEVFSKQLT